MSIAPAKRLSALPAYLFAEIDRKKTAAIAAGRDIIDFGVGDPDQPTYSFIVEAMHAALAKPELHRYPLGGGMPAFRKTIAEFMQRRYGVSVDPQRETLALIGSKEGIGHLPLAVVNPGDTVIVPSPGYPVYHASTLFAGGTPWTLALTDANGWLVDFSTIPSDVARAARLLFVNYPNNPTGAVADLAFYRGAVAFCREHDILLASDAAYNEMSFEGPRPPSVLEVPDARDIAIEFHSASKTFNMTGWRVGFAVGSADAVAALTKIKSNLDSGVFGAVQEAAIAAYRGVEHPELEASRTLYRTRGGLLCEALRGLGFRAQAPKATFYVWAAAPGGLDSMTVANRLLEEINVVCVPGVGFGAAGEGFVRFSLSVPTERIHTAIERMRGLSWRN